MNGSSGGGGVPTGSADMKRRLPIVTFDGSMLDTQLKQGQPMGIPASSASRHCSPKRPVRRLRSKWGSPPPPAAEPSGCATRVSAPRPRQDTVLLDKGEAEEGFIDALRSHYVRSGTAETFVPKFKSSPTKAYGAGGAAAGTTGSASSRAGPGRLEQQERRLWEEREEELVDAQDRHLAQLEDALAAREAKRDAYLVHRLEALAAEKIKQHCRHQEAASRQRQLAAKHAAHLPALKQAHAAVQPPTKSTSLQRLATRSVFPASANLAPVVERVTDTANSLSDVSMLEVGLASRGAFGASAHASPALQAPSGLPRLGIGRSSWQERRQAKASQMVDQAYGQIQAAKTAGGRLLSPLDAAKDARRISAGIPLALDAATPSTAEQGHAAINEESSASNLADKSMAVMGKDETAGIYSADSLPPAVPSVARLARDGVDPREVTVVAPCGDTADRAAAEASISRQEGMQQHVMDDAVQDSSGGTAAVLPVLMAIEVAAGAEASPEVQAAGAGDALCVQVETAGVALQADVDRQPDVEATNYVEEIAETQNNGMAGNAMLDTAQDEDSITQFTAANCTPAALQPTVHDAALDANSAGVEQEQVTVDTAAELQQQQNQPEVEQPDLHAAPCIELQHMEAEQPSETTAAIAHAAPSSNAQLETGIVADEEAIGPGPGCSPLVVVAADPQVGVQAAAALGLHDEEEAHPSTADYEKEPAYTPSVEREASGQLAEAQISAPTKGVEGDGNGTEEISNEARQAGSQLQPADNEAPAEQEEGAGGAEQAAQASMGSARSMQEVEEAEVALVQASLLEFAEQRMGGMLSTGKDNSSSLGDAHESRAEGIAIQQVEQAELALLQEGLLEFAAQSFSHMLNASAEGREECAGEELLPAAATNCSGIEGSSGGSWASEEAEESQGPQQAADDMVGAVDLLADLPKPSPVDDQTNGN